MAVPSEWMPLGFSLATLFSWGTSDFLGGYAARRANAFLLTTIVHGAGTLFMAAVVILGHATLPSRHAMGWAMAAGLSGGAALALFYRALADGKMGLAAPVSAVLSAAIPTVVGMATEGFPGKLPLLGFVLAGIGIWLISRTEDKAPARGLWLAVLAGFGFAGYFLCTKQAGSGSALWISVVARAASFMLTAVITVFAGSRTINSSGVALGVLAGCLDVTGSAVFVRAAQVGRLDAAVVLSSLYPAVTVLLARLVLHEHFTRWRMAGVLACVVAIPLIATH